MNNNNNTLRDHSLFLLNKYIEFLDTNKIMVTVINVALNKNNKIKTDILDLAINLVSKETLNISTFQEIYSNMGKELCNMIEISDKDKEFLEENLIFDCEEDEKKEGEDDEMENDDINNDINN